ncbi:MAG: two-component regulator propeller domain-containing protein [Owenweeksia sp.]|nr:two-component regulator propeller domain-containing protein [Owenweeksia sp.]
MLSSSLYAQQYHFTNLGLHDGLPQSQVFALCEDHQGYLWMGTRGGGLGRFNGQTFTNYSSRDGLASNYISCLDEDHSGTLWIGTDRGLSSYDGYQFKTQPLSGDNQPVVALLEDDQKQLWAATKKGLWRKQDSLFAPMLQAIFEREDLQPQFLKQAPDGSIWMGTNQGIYIYEGTDSLRQLTIKNGLPTNEVRSMTSDAAGNIWIGTYGHGAWLVNESGIYSMNRYTGLDGAIVTDILSDESGLLWLATTGLGLCKYNLRDSSAVFLTEKDGLANNHLRNLLLDRWGNYWIGTSGGGVSKYAGQQFERFTERDGLPGSYIYSVTADLRNQLWIGTSGGGITRYNGTRFAHFNRDSGFTNTKCRALLVARDSSRMDRHRRAGIGSAAR